MNEPASVHHIMIAIPAGGEDAARSFYVDLLNLCEIPKPPALVARGGLWLSTGSIDVHLGVDPDFAPARKAHLALLVNDLDELRRRLAHNGGAPGAIERELPGFRRCYVDDPFGNRIELMQSL